MSRNDCSVRRASASHCNRCGTSQQAVPCQRRSGCCVQIPLPKGSTATVHLLLRVSSASQPTKSLSTPPLTTTRTSPLTHRTFRLHGVLAIPLSQSLPGSPEMMALNDESSEDEFATPPHQQAMTDQVTSYRHTIRANPCPEATCCVIFVALSRARGVKIHGCAGLVGI